MTAYSPPSATFSLLQPSLTHSPYHYCWWSNIVPYLLIFMFQLSHIATLLYQFCCNVSDVSCKMRQRQCMWLRCALTTTIHVLSSNPDSLTPPLLLPMTKYCASFTDLYPFHCSLSDFSPLLLGLINFPLISIWNEDLTSDQIKFHPGSWNRLRTYPWVPLYYNFHCHFPLVTSTILCIDVIKVIIKTIISITSLNA